MTLPTMKSRAFSRIRLMCLMAILAVFLPRGHAQITNVWTNTVNGVWTAVTNWTPAPPLSATNTVIQFNASGTTSYRATNTTANFLLNRMVLNSSSISNIFIVGSSLIFMPNGSANLPQILQQNSGNVVISNGIGASTNLTFGGTGSGTVTVMGSIASNINLIKTGSNTLNLFGANSFGGSNRSIAIQGGTLAVSNSGNLGNALNSITVSSNATLQFLGTFSVGRPVIMETGGGRVDVAGTNAVTFNVALGTNANLLTKTGTGTLLAQIANAARTGQTAVNAGVLQVDNASALGTGAITVSGGTLALSNATLANAITLAGGALGGTGNQATRIFTGPISVTQTSAVRLADARVPSGASVVNLQLTGVLSGSSNLVVQSGSLPASLTLSNALNTYSGNFTVLTNATLIATHTNGSSLGTASVTLQPGGTLSIRRSGGFVTNFLYTNNLVVNGPAVLDVRRANSDAMSISNTITMVGSLTVSSNFYLVNSNFFSVRFAGPITLVSNAAFYTSNNFLSLDGLITESNGPSTLTKSGPNFLFFTNLNDNLYSGGTVIDRGIAVVWGGSNLTSGVFVTNPLGLGDVVLDSAFLQLRSDTNQTFGPGAGYNITALTNSRIDLDRITTNGGTGRIITLGSIKAFGNLGLTIANAYQFVFQSNNTLLGNLVISNNGNVIFNGSFTDNGTNYSMTKLAAGRIFMTNLVNSTYGGGTDIRVGQVRVAGSPTVTTPLGTGPITLSGGSLELRSDASHTYGPGNGHTITLVSNSTINPDRISTGAAHLLMFDSLTLGTNALTVASGNSVAIGFVQGMELTNNRIFGTGFLAFSNTVTLRGSNALDATFRFASNVVFGSPTNFLTTTSTLVLNGYITQSVAGARLVKFGAGTLFITNVVNNDFTGGTLVNAGTLQVAADGANRTPLGNENVVLAGGNLNLRSLGSQIIGPGNGYAIGVHSNTAISVDRFGGANQNGLIQIGRLTNNNSMVTVNGVNNFNLVVADETVLSGTGSFNVAATRSANPFSLLLAGQIVETAPGAVLHKSGAQNLGYTNFLGPLHTGGTIIENGQLVWRPTNALPGTYQFGAGAIRVDGGFGSSFAFQHGNSNGYRLVNDFILSAGLQNGAGPTLNGGGVLDFTPQGVGRPLVTNFGDIQLKGPLQLTAGAVGGYNTVLSPITFEGTVTVAGDDRRLVIDRSGSGVGNRIVFNSAFTQDGAPRRLTVIANNAAGVDFGGSNGAYTGSFRISPSYVGAVGRVLFSSPNAIPGGGVTVDSGAFVGLTFDLLAAGITNVLSQFTFGPEAVLGLATNISGAIDLSPSGVNKDVRLGVPEGFTVGYTGQLTPYSNVFKIGGGLGTWNQDAINGLRDDGSTNRSLSINPVQFAVPIGAAVQPGTVNISTSNSYTGGTLVNSGTLNFTAGRINTPLGTGPIETYALVNATGGNGSFANTAGSGNNNSVIITHPNSEIRLDNANSLNTNRFGNAAPLTLNGATLRLIGRTGDAQVRTEVMGDLDYALGSQVTISGVNVVGSSTVLSVSNLNRVGNGTLQINRAVSLGGFDRLVVGNAPATSNSMVAPYIVNATDSTFVNYGPTGFTNVIYDSTDINTAGTNSLVSNTVPASLSTDRVVHALRTTQGISAGASSNLNVLSGGLILIGNALSANLNLSFGPGGTDEGLIYVQGGSTHQLNGFTLNASTLTKFGEGALRINTPITYGNGWNVNRGTLIAGTNDALGLTVPGNFVNLNGSATLQLSSTASNAVYSGGKITSLDSNTLVLDFGVLGDRIQSYASGLDLNSISNGALGSLLNVRESGNRNVFNVLGPVTLGADAALNVVNLTFPITGGSNRFVLAGGLAGAGRTLTKYGSGTLVLSNDNSATFTGGRILVEGGVLGAGHNGAFGNGASTVQIAENTVLEILAPVINFIPVASVTQKPGSAERWQSSVNRFSDTTTPETYIVPANVNLQLAANLTNLSSKTIRMTGGALEAFNYADDLRANNISIGTGVTLELAADLKIGQSGVDIARNGTIFSNNAAITEIGGSRSLIKVGLDTVQMGNNASTYTGDTLVNGGTMRLGIDGALPTGTRLGVTNYAAFNLNGFDQTVRSLRGSGVITNSSALLKTLTIGNPGNPAESSFSGGIGGNLNLIKQGSGTLTLSGANRYTGSLQIYEGTVAIGSTFAQGAGALGVAASQALLVGIFGDAALLTMGAVTVPQPIVVESFFGGLKTLGGGSAHVSSYDGPVTLSDYVKLTAAAGGRVNFTNTITDGGLNFGISKEGDGVVNLAGANGFLQPTFVNAGTLLVNNKTGSATGSGDVTVNGGAALGGAGRIAGSVTITDGAVLAPGDATGGMRIDAGLSFAASATVAFEIGSLIQTNEYRLLSVTNAASLAGTMKLALDEEFFPANNFSFTLMKFGSRVGMFTGVTNGVTLAVTNDLGANVGSMRVNFSTTNLTASNFLFTDSDGDGLPDAWVEYYFGTGVLPNGAGPDEKYGDKDGDGQNNYGEYVAGTNPLDENSAFKVSTFAPAGGANLAVQFTFISGRAYRVQYTSNLVNWLTVTNPVLTYPQPGFAQFLDNGSQTGGTPPLNLPGMRSYRVQIVP